MRKLIELGVAIDATICAVDEWDGGYDIEREKRIRDALMALPTVDAVPVVRCKDCKYWKTGEGVNRSKKVKFCTYNIGHHYARRDEDFCSRGERKEGEQHE